MISALDLLDQPPLTPDEYGVLEAGLTRLVGGERDIVLVQAEAILALEAIAASIAARGRRAVNVVTGPYGRLFGHWLRRGGAEVVDLETAFDEVVTADAVATALAQHRPDILAIVHAEAATGGTNPIAKIAALARDAGVVTVLDSVSAVGAEPVRAAEWGIDLVAIGGQKSLAAPPSPSAVAVSPRAWEFIEANPAAPRMSSLSLLDWRDGWLRSDRSTIPGLPSWLDSRAFIAAIERIEAEGIDAVHLRHRRAAAASVAGFAALGLSPWQRRAEARAPIVTTVRLPERGAAGDGAWGGILTAGVAGPEGSFFRVNHYGRAAALEPVLDALVRAGAALDAPAGARRDAESAATAAWEQAR